MKLILENWRKYLDEVDAAGGSLPSAEDPESAKLVQNFLKDLLVITQAAEDSANEEELEEGSAVRAGRMARKSRQYQTKQIKQRAGLAGVKIANFTAEQRQLYDTAKQEFLKAQDNAEQVFVQTLAVGDLTNLPLVRNIIQLGGPRLKQALADACPTGALNMTCIMHYLNQQAQGF
jgi:hypothetical protein